MRKFLSIILALAFLAGGTAWAKRNKSEPNGTTKTHSSKKPKKNTKGKKKGKKGAKSSKGQANAKAETDFNKSDVEIDLKGQ